MVHEIGHDVSGVLKRQRSPHPDASALYRLVIAFQTALLERVSGMEESQKTSDAVYVPSEEYFSAVGGLFEISEGAQSLLENVPALRAGDLNQRQGQLGGMILDYNLFQTYKIETPAGRTLYLSPGRHMDALYSFAFHLVGKSKGRDAIEMVLQENCRKQAQKICRRFFTVRGTLAGLYGMKSEENLAEKVDFAGVTDGGKILLFKVLPAYACRELGKQLSAAEREVGSVVDAMRADDFIGLRYATEPEKVPAVPISVVEMFRIYVIPRLTLEPYVVTRRKGMGDQNSFVLVLTDMQRVFEHIDSPLAFVKFLRDDNELKKKSRIFSTDFLDRFICYIENGNRFFIEGKAFTGVSFHPHSWSDYYAEKLYIERNDPLYELVERYFPSYFNKIDKKDGGLYMLADTATLTCAYAMIFNGGLVMVSLPPDGYFCTGEEVKLLEFLCHFYAYYFKKLEASLKKFLEDHEISLDELYTISVVPVTYVRRHDLKYLAPLVARISEEKPIDIMTGRVKGRRNLRTAVVFDGEFLLHIFSQKDNRGERRAFLGLLISLLEYMKPEMTRGDIESLGEAFIEKVMPVGPRAFSLDAVPIDNPKVEKYREHDEPSGSDVGRVERITGEHIANSGVEPGTCEGAEAVRILESCFDFVSEKVEEELRAFNQSIVHRAFEQLEFIEYERISLGIRAGVDSCKYVEYDVEGRFIEEYNKISRAAVAVKYLCTNVIKLGPGGAEAVDRESRDRVLALAYWAVDLSYLIDLVRYDLRQHNQNKRNVQDHP